MNLRDGAGRRPRDRRRNRALARPAGRSRVAPAAICVVAIVVALAETAFGGRVGADPVPAWDVAPSSGRASDALVVGPAEGIAAAPTEGAKVVGDAPRPTTGDARSGRVAPSPAGAGVAVAPCRFDDVPAPHARLDDWATTVIDTAFVLPDDYHPPDLVPVTRAGIAGWGLVRSLVVDDLGALADAARDAGNPLAVQSAYRGRSRQAEVFAGWVARSGEAQARRFSARPGHSEHELGTALDLRATAGGAPWTGAFGSTAAGRWLARHAPDYGFVLSYPAGAESVTCYGAEPWHIRYVGRAMAAAVAASGLPLRAWLLKHDGGR